MKLATKTQEEDYLAFARNYMLYEPLRGKTIAITGATGLLGVCMVNCLRALDEAHQLGLTVVCIIRNKEKAVAMFGKETNRLHYTIHDFSTGEPLKIAESIDYFVHFASPTASKYFVTNPVETMLTGLNGTTQVLDYAREKTIWSVVYVSSLEVYGTVLDDAEPLTEERQGYLDPMQTRSGYPMVKRAAECLCHAYASEYHVHVKTARLAQTFGAGVAKDDGRVFAQFARNVIAGEDIVLHTTGELARCYCYTTDAIEALLYILLVGTDGEAYNVANEESYISIRKMAEMLCQTFNPAIKPVIELKEGMGYSPTTKLRLSCKKVEALGWQPRYDLRTMFERLINYLKE